MNWDQIVHSMRRLSRHHRLPRGFAARTVALLDASRPEDSDTQATTDAAASAIPDASPAHDGPTSPPGE